jgi:hypothetical protein
MKRISIALALAFAVSVSWGAESGPYSVSANLIARAMNSENTDGVPESQKIDNRAYSINFSYNIELEGASGDSLGRRIQYYSLRLFQWKNSFSESTATAVNAGVYGVKGMAALYGRRYFVDRKSYQGLAFGLYGGLASMKQRSAVFQSQIKEESVVTPIAGTEVLYRVDVWRNVYVEPTVSVAYWKTKAGLFLPTVAVNLGATF